jgi:hypothetical protein
MPKTKEITYKLCPKGHKNSPNAKTCWVCGEPIEAPAPKPTFIQKTNTVVHTTPINLNDVNKVVADECERYVGKRERCDSKDPSGITCGFIHNCAVRLKRYQTKPALDVNETVKTT